MLRAGRGGLLLGLAAVVASSAPGCFILRCDDPYHGVQRGEHFTTTILGPYTEGYTGSGATSCADLGDLPPGTTLTWTALPDGPGDGCYDHLEMQVSAVSTGTVSKDTLTLPNGCTGTWMLSAHPVHEDTGFLANDLEEPRWYIQRMFRNASSACPTASTGCTDFLVASSTQ